MKKLGEIFHKLETFVRTFLVVIFSPALWLVSVLISPAPKKATPVREMSKQPPKYSLEKIDRIVSIFFFFFSTVCLLAAHGMKSESPIKHDGIDGPLTYYLLAIVLFAGGFSLLFPKATTLIKNGLLRTALGIAGLALIIGIAAAILAVAGTIPGAIIIGAFIIAGAVSRKS